MGCVVSVVNQKGGVGKTTTSVNLATALSLTDKKVLLIDMDPQGNATSAFQQDPRHPGLYEAFSENLPLKKVIQKTEMERLHLISSKARLATTEALFLNQRSWEFLLKDKLRSLKENYNYIFIDCPPSLNGLTINALSASEECLIPLQCEYYALEGLCKLMETIDRVRSGLNPGLRLRGILLTLFDQRNKLSHQVATEVKKHFEDKVFETIVPRNVRLSEAPSFGKSIFQYDPRSVGARRYFDLSLEFVKDRV